MARQGYEWAVTKSGPPSANLHKPSKDDYPFHERASTAYTHYITGYTEEEILGFFNSSGIDCSLEDVEHDIQHIRTLMPLRVLLSQENDRNRLLLQRTEGKQYRRLLAESLSLTANDYLRVGISPTGPLREYREAVGMQEKPGGISVHVTQQNMNLGGASAQGLNSSEDLLRRVMDRMKSQAPPTIEQPAEAIEIEAEPAQAAEETDVFELEAEERIPDPD